jgi:hypothetical protein
MAVYESTLMDVFGTADTDHIDGNRIWNMDETPFNPAYEDSGVLIGEKGAPRPTVVVDVDREFFTGVICVNAAGGLMAPTFLYRGTKAKASYYNHFSEEDLPYLVSPHAPGAGPMEPSLGAVKKGSQTCESFRSWLDVSPACAFSSMATGCRLVYTMLYLLLWCAFLVTAFPLPAVVCLQVFHAHLVKEKVQFPVLLTLDNHSSHVSVENILAAKKLRIEVLALPPQTTALTQPLDAFINQHIKHKWKKGKARYVEHGHCISNSTIDHVMPY